MSARRRAIALLTALALCATPAAAQETAPLKGLSLTEALRVMQSRGLRIVFTSAVVVPQLRVNTEPRGATPRQQLDDLLAAHNLEVREGPGRILQVVRAETRAKKPPAPPSAGSKQGSGVPPRTHSEFVTVTDAAPYRTDRGVITEMSFERADTAALRGTLSEDPYRVVQSFPRVAAVNDFATDFVVRASPFRHVNQVIEGVSTPLLQHTTLSGTAAGSLSMVSGPVLDHVTLRTGAYPRRNGDRLGPELELRLREGSRAGFALRGALGGSHALVLAEGPLAARGSWLVAARQSYLEWPPQQSASRTPFGFSDGVAKVTFDVGRTQQLAFTALGGSSASDVEDDLLQQELGGSNTAAVFTISWEARLRRALVITQRGYLVRQHAFDRAVSLREDRLTNEQAGYRIDLSRPVAAGLFEAGAQIGRGSILETSSQAGAVAMTGSSRERSGYAHFAWAVRPSLTISPGFRITSSTLVRSPAVSPWVLGEWSFRPAWSLNVSAGISNQLPPLHAVVVNQGSPSLTAERAKQIDIGIEHRPTASVRWQATLFSRREAGVLREPYAPPLFVRDSLLALARTPYDNGLAGTSKGIEVLVERRSAFGLSGWAAYSYGRSIETDSSRRETYWSDFDQRHTFNLFAVYRLSRFASIGGTLRAGSNFPIAGYFTRAGQDLVAGSLRNQIRLPPYVRLDLRAERQFHYFGRRLTPFVEVLNALDRVNTGRSEGRVNPITGEALGFTDVLLRRRVSAGVVIEF